LPFSMAFRCFVRALRVFRCLRCRYSFVDVVSISGSRYRFG
jgi:hypothetical protein